MTEKAAPLAQPLFPLFEHWCFVLVSNFGFWCFEFDAKRAACTERRPVRFQFSYDSAESPDVSFASAGLVSWGFSASPLASALALAASSFLLLQP